MTIETTSYLSPRGRAVALMPVALLALTFLPHCGDLTTTSKCSKVNMVTLSGTIKHRLYENPDEVEPIQDVRVLWTTEFPESGEYVGETTTSDENGHFAFDCVPVGVPGSLQFEHDDYLTTVTSLITPEQSVDAVIMNMVTPEDNKLYNADWEVEADSTRGSIVCSVNSSEVLFHISTPDGNDVPQEEAIGPYYTTYGQPVKELTSTNKTDFIPGIGGFLNVEPGIYKVRATLHGQAVPVAFGHRTDPIIVRTDANTVTSVMFRVKD